MIKLLTALVISGTLSTGFMDKTKIPVVETKEAFEQHIGEKVFLVGTYTPMMLPQSKRPGSKMIPSGRVSINLGDFEIALDRDKKGIRSKEEVKKYSGKKVKVKGVLNKMVTLWGNGEEQSIIMPAITEIESVVFLK